MVPDGDEPVREFQHGETVQFMFHADRIHLFSRETEQNLEHAPAAPAAEEPAPATEEPRSGSRRSPQRTLRPTPPPAQPRGGFSMPTSKPAISRRRGGYQPPNRTRLVPGGLE